MQSVIENGTGRIVRSLGFKRPAAGKTGTSNQSRDAWFAGYTPTLLTVVWVGFDDNSPTGLTGGSGAAPIWTEYNKCVSSMEPISDFKPPPGVVFKKIDAATGLIATRYCPRSNVVTEVFVEGANPITPCNLHAPHLDNGEFQNNQPSRRNRQPRRESSGILDWFGL